MFNHRSLIYTIAILVIAVVMSSLQGFASVSRAQVFTPTPTLNTGNVTLLERKDATTFAAPWRNTAAVSGAFLLGIAKATGFTDYSIPTKIAFRWDCNFIQVYRVTDHADLILHPSVCANDMFSFESVGSGHYILYGFGTKFGTQHAPHDILLPGHIL